MKKVVPIALYLIFSIGIFRTSAATGINYKTSLTSDTIKLADPTIFFDKGVYYLYGTGSKDGFWVYTSTDLKHWSGPAGKRNGHALLKGDAYGTQGFWAPQVFKHNKKYYMAYTADEHIAIAQSDSPLGPFVQQHIGPVSGAGKQIDPYIFKDTNGSLYLYHVRLQNGNRIFVARLKADLSDIDTATVKECLHAEAGWENTATAGWPVSEGPTVLKRSGLYYLFYSANDFRNIDYAVGYATSQSPLGPWVKNKDNPIISRKIIGVNGTGHGDFFTDAKGLLHYVLHTHNSSTAPSPRKTAILTAKFVKSKPAKVLVDPKSFRYLIAN